MAKRPPSFVLVVALLCLSACSSNEGPKATQSAAPAARRTATTTDSDSRYLNPTGAIGAIAVESSPLEGRYVPVQPDRSGSARAGSGFVPPLPPALPVTNP